MVYFIVFAIINHSGRTRNILSCRIVVVGGVCVRANVSCSRSFVISRMRGFLLSSAFGFSAFACRVILSIIFLVAVSFVYRACFSWIRREVSGRNSHSLFGAVFSSWFIEYESTCVYHSYELSVFRLYFKFFFVISVNHLSTFLTWKFQVAKLDHQCNFFYTLCFHINCLFSLY